MTDGRRATGQLAEDLCALRLENLGWQLIERNWRVRSGELDLIALDGDTLVFVEVKALHSNLDRGPVLPVLAVGEKKQRRLRRLGEAWIAWRGHRALFEEVRFDVVGVRYSQEGEILDYQHIQNAF